jgi:hypothetical protein
MVNDRQYEEPKQNNRPYHTYHHLEFNSSLAVLLGSAVKEDNIKFHKKKSKCTLIVMALERRMP